MNKRLSDFFVHLRDIPPVWIRATTAILIALIAFLSADLWLPGLQGLFHAQAEAKKEAEDAHHGEETNSIVVSEQARRNIGLTVGEVKLDEFTRTITVPAKIVKLTGRNHMEVSAPMNGVITEMTVVLGQAIWSDALLFRLKVTHEDLVQLQTDYLRTLGRMDAELKEITRLKKIVDVGVAGQLLLQREYERDKLLAVQRAQEESLELHGLKPQQVERIRKRRKLEREVTIIVPRLHRDFSIHYDNEASRNPISQADKDVGIRRRFVVEELPVHVGKSVKAGDKLCLLADYSELHIAGQAFEQDAAAIVDAANRQDFVSAIPESLSKDSIEVHELRIVHIDNEIDPVSRALRFHVALRNDIVGDVEREGRKYITWKFKPGQRMQLRVPVRTNKWLGMARLTAAVGPVALRLPRDKQPPVIVLPVDAVAQEGAEYYVFRENGKTFVRQPVVVQYRDPFQVVVAYDGSISPGERIAMSGAHQLLVALKNKASGGGGGHHHHHH